jgi:hypothetical protein
MFEEGRKSGYRTAKWREVASFSLHEALAAPILLSVCRVCVQVWGHVITALADSKLGRLAEAEEGRPGLGCSRSRI